MRLTCLVHWLKQWHAVTSASSRQVAGEMVLKICAQVHANLALAVTWMALVLQRCNLPVDLVTIILQL